MATEFTEGTVSRGDPNRARPRWGVLALVGLAGVGLLPLGRSLYVFAAVTRRSGL